ncbi:MAG TPA: methylmalonyl-CoA epimerase [Gemmatimonadales bacterium]|jgi:methylmalonyl-CoA/ethylmalonyl-CoA epimerase
MQPVIAHLGIAVADLDASLAFYRDVLGLEPQGEEIADGARIVHLDLGTSEVELLQPVTGDSPIAKFLARRGPGLHHVCYRVADLDAALAACRRNGYSLIDETPRVGAGGRRIAFVHPKASHGTLIELTE